MKSHKKPAAPKTRELTSREKFDSLSPNDQFKLLSDAEFDAIGFERLLRNTRDEMDRTVADLHAKIKQQESAGEDEARIINQQSLEIRDLANDKRTLIRQLKDLNQEPLRS